MARDEYLFTSESVTEGHPDKIADQISDAVLDSILAQDPVGRVACETLLTTGLVVVAGEITTSCYVDIPKIVRETIKNVGYTRAKFGFDYETCGVIAAIDAQSPDIAMGVDNLGRGRPGPDVRLRLHGDGRADAVADHARPQARAAPRGRPQEGRARLSAARRQEPGVGSLRGRQAGERRDGRHLHAARPRRAAREDPDGHDRARHPPHDPRPPHRTRTRSPITSIRRGASSPAVRWATRA